MAEVKVRMLRALGTYAVGDEREMSTADANRLEQRGVVEIVTKAEPAVLKNKAEGPAPKNKGAKGRKA